MKNMKNKLIGFASIVGFTIMPLLVFAQSGSGTDCKSLAANPKFQDLVCYVVNSLLSAVIPLIFALAIVMFAWGVVRYVIGADDEKERERGKQFMVWGIIALSVMVSVWGLVHIVTNTFGFDFGVPMTHQ